MTTGVKVSLMRPFFTSPPVATMQAVLRTKGFSCSRGAGPAACSAFCSFSSAIIRGITRMPASLSPLRTAVPPLRVAIITSSWLFTATRRGLSTRNRPSQAAFSSILPSFTSLRVMFSWPHSLSSRSAASFSWTMPGVISQTYRCSLPMDSSTGMSSSVTTWPLRKRASLY